MTEMDDNTGCEIERLNQTTDDVRDMFKMLSTVYSNEHGLCDSPLVTHSQLYKKVKELLIALDARGFMTIFGMRTSPGSQNTVWPKKSLILESMNKKYKKDRARPRVIHPNNMSILTVGGRALTKH